MLSKLHAPGPSSRTKPTPKAGDSKSSSNSAKSNSSSAPGSHKASLLYSASCLNDRMDYRSELAGCTCTRCLAQPWLRPGCFSCPLLPACTPCAAPVSHCWCQPAPLRFKSSFWTVVLPLMELLQGETYGTMKLLLFPTSVLGCSPLLPWLPSPPAA